LRNAESFYACHSFVTSDGLRTYLFGNGLFVMQRSTRGDPFTPNMQVMSASAFDWPVLTDDELTLFVFASYPPARIQMATRASANESFSTWTNLDVTSGPSVPTWVSPDACRLYLTGADGGVYVASREP
jgi:hypothetical protein